MQAKLTAVADDVVDVKTDMRSLKGHMAAFMQAEVAQDGADLHVEGAGTPLHLSGQFDAHEAINIVLYPEDGYRRVEIKDVAVSHAPLDF